MIPDDGDRLQPDLGEPAVDDLLPSTALRLVALEVEQHVGSDGWDQAPRLFALAPTAELVRREPALAEALAVALRDQPDGLTPIEQDGVTEPFEHALDTMGWPEFVVGCAAVIERVMLPAHIEQQVPDDAEELARFVAAHPERQEVRLVAAVTRDGQRHTMVRSRTRPDAQLLEGPDLVPGLVESLLGTLT